MKLLAMLLVLAFGCASAAAQDRPAAKGAPSAAEGPPNAVQGFSRNKGQPVHIEAARLEVRDKDKMATFSGNVQVNQGDTEMRCKTLKVFYEANAAPSAGKPGNPVATTATPSNAGPSGEQRIKKLEARGDVVVTQNDQIATGELAHFDMEKNVVTVTGNVVLTQGQNVLRGDRLVVDMTTGYSRIESGKGKDGRVQGLFLPGAGRPNLPGIKPGGN